MTLADMADFVCAKVRLRDSESLVICKNFIRQRHEMIWDMGLWKDSIYQLKFTIDLGIQPPPASPNCWESATRGIWYLPHVVDRVLAVRTTDRSLSPVDEVNFYRVDLDKYEETGTPVEYIPLPRVVFQSFKYNTVGFYVENAADVGTKIVIDVLDGNYRPVTEEMTLDTFSKNPACGAVWQLDRVTKGVTNGDILISGGDTLSPVMRVKAAEKEYTPRARVQILPAPTENTTFKALIKRKIIPMERDNDQPALRNMDNVLIPFVQADMYEYDRKIGAAAEKVKEATTLLNEMKKAVMLQDAGHTRLMPEPDGYAAGDTPSKTDW